MGGVREVRIEKWEQGDKSTSRYLENEMHWAKNLLDFSYLDQ